MSDDVSKRVQSMSDADKLAAAERERDEARAAAETHASTIATLTEDLQAARLDNATLAAENAHLRAQLAAGPVMPETPSEAALDAIYAAGEHDCATLYAMLRAALPGGA